MTLPSYERLGVFYLGREYDPATQQIGADLLYDSRDLTTHAVCIGMTGSGKTGLCLSLLEEAALDGVPAIAIDPKGDIGNLLLTFPELRAEDFRPWVDEGEASRKGKTVDEFADCDRRQLAQGPRRVGTGRCSHCAAARSRGRRHLHTRLRLRPAIVRAALVRGTRSRDAERRHRVQGTHQLGRRRAARAARHRGRPDQEPRAHAAVGDPRHGVARRARAPTSPR